MPPAPSPGRGHVGHEGRIIGRIASDSSAGGRPARGRPPARTGACARGQPQSVRAAVGRPRVLWVAGSMTDEPAGGGAPSSSGLLWPRLADPPRRFDWAVLPTPVDRAPWLDTPHATVWIKRDDRSSPIYGGGKVRKLQWVLANPPYDGDAPVLSMGGTGSHHLLALALFLAPQRRTLHALVFEQPWTPHVRRNLAVLVSTGAKLWTAKTRPGLGVAWLAYRLWRRPAIAGTYMAAGASTALGCFGFIEAALELAAQIAAGALPRPDVIYLTAGSAGSCAGLLVGLALAGVSTHVHLVSSVEAWAFNGVLLRRKLAAAEGELRARGLVDAPTGGVMRWLERAGVTFAIDHAEVGGGYGAPTAAGLDAVALAGAHGLALETTYTAKCLAALRRIEAARGGPRRNVLWWNTHAGNDLSDRIAPDWRARCPIAVPDE